MAARFDCSGRVAIVTGGAGLLGEPIVRGLADHGADVVIADTDADRGETVAEEVDGVFRDVDVTDDAEVEALVEETVERAGSLDVLVNSAYPHNENYGAPYESVTVEDWNENLRLHLGGYFAAIKHASEVMVDQADSGSIVSIGSIYGVQAPDFSLYEGLDVTSPVEYAAIKGGLLNLTRYLASYLGPAGVRVNSISPGGVKAGQSAEFVSRYADRTPLGRMANPEDIVGAAVYLASDASSYVTGQNIVVDGGWTIQ